MISLRELLEDPRIVTNVPKRFSLLTAVPVILDTLSIVNFTVSHIVPQALVAWFLRNMLFIAGLEFEKYAGKNCKLYYSCKECW